MSSFHKVGTLYVDVWKNDKDEVMYEVESNPSRLPVSDVHTILAHVVSLLEEELNE